MDGARLETAETSYADQLSAALRRGSEDLLLVVTGAGVSAASGLPTFRGKDPEAVWNRDVLEKGTRQYFEAQPVASWQWYLERFDGLLQAAPNPAHQALAALERWQQSQGGQFLLVTQNVDTLHEDAGSEALVKVHGTVDRLRCSREGCAQGSPVGSVPRSDYDAQLRDFSEAPSLDLLPRCPGCESLLRPHVLWFDEYYTEHRDYQFERVEAATAQAALVLFAGTSFAVGVTDLALKTATRNGAPVYTIDPALRDAWYTRGVYKLAAPAEILLPEVCGLLGAPLPGPRA